MLCFRAAIFAFVGFVLAVLRAADMVVFFRMLFRMPLWAGQGVFFLVVRFVSCVCGTRLIGDMLNEELTVGNDGPGLSIGVDVPCCCCERLCHVGADKGLGASGLCALPGRVSLFSPDGCAFSAKHNFFNLRLFLLYSSTVLHATKFIKRSSGSGVLYAFPWKQPCRCYVLLCFYNYLCRW